MWVIPKTNSGGYSDYENVDSAKNVFPTEILSSQRDMARAVPCILQANEASLHHAKTMHGSPANTSKMRPLRLHHALHEHPLKIQPREI